MTIEFRWVVSFTIEKTGSLSDEPFRSCRDDAVLGGCASTSRLAPNRALSLCTKVDVVQIEFCAKFERCSINGLEVIAFLVFASKMSLVAPERGTRIAVVRKRFVGFC